MLCEIQSFTKPTLVPKHKIPDLLTLVMHRKTAQKKTLKSDIQVVSPRINEHSVKLLSQSKDPEKVLKVQGSQKDKVSKLCKQRSDDGVVKMRETLSQIEMSKCTFTP